MISRAFDAESMAIISHPIAKWAGIPAAWHPIHQTPAMSQPS